MFEITDVLKLRFQHEKGQPLKVVLQNDIGDEIRLPIGQVTTPLKELGFRYVVGTNGIWSRV